MILVNSKHREDLEYVGSDQIRSDQISRLLRALRRAALHAGEVDLQRVRSLFLAGWSPEPINARVL